MLLQLLPRGLRDHNSSREAWISLLKACDIYFDVEKVLVGFQSGVGRAVPGGAAPQRMKSPSWRLWVEHPPRGSRRIQLLVNRPLHRNTRVMCNTAQSEGSLGKGAGCWSQMGKGKELLYTQFNPHLEEKKNISNTFSPLCSILKKKCIVGYIFSDFKACLERSCAPHFRVKLASSENF